MPCLQTPDPPSPPTDSLFPGPPARPPAGSVDRRRRWWSGGRDACRQRWSVQLVLIERRQRPRRWSHRGITGLRGRAQAARSRSSGRSQGGEARQGGATACPGQRDDPSGNRPASMPRLIVNSNTFSFGERPTIACDTASSARQPPAVSRDAPRCLSVRVHDVWYPMSMSSGESCCGRSCLRFQPASTSTSLAFSQFYHYIQHQRAITIGNGVLRSNRRNLIGCNY